MSGKYSNWLLMYKNLGQLLYIDIYLSAPANKGKKYNVAKSKKYVAKFFWSLTVIAQTNQGMEAIIMVNALKNMG